MAETKNAGADETARLEAALERIAQVVEHPARPLAAPPGAALRHRLDALIADIRAALGKDGD